MLLKDFYELRSLTTTGAGTHTAIICINAAHDIIKAHFPGNPVTPGVCMMQVIKEITEQVVGRVLVLQTATNVKFTALINPEITPLLKLDLEINEGGGTYKVKNTTYFDDTVALKLSCVYSIR